ncbi:hypothetical protein ACSBR1_041788 [Camellia fascicularis]
MSSGSRPVTDLGKESVENGTVPDFISHLRSSFKPGEFDKVQQILMAREENMKSEIALWKKEYEYMEKKNFEMAATNFKIQEERNKYKVERNELREKNKRLKVEDNIHREIKEGHCKRLMKAEEKYEKLLERHRQVQSENVKLVLMLTAMNSAKNKSLNELEINKQRFKELILRVLRVEDEASMLMVEGHACEKKKEDVGAERPVSDKLMAEKTSDNGKSQHEMAVGTVDESLANLQSKGSSSNCFEEINSMAGSDSVAVSLGVGNNRLQEAGAHSVIMAGNNKKPIQDQLVLERGSSNKVKNTSVARGRRTGYGVIIDLDDSDDEMPTKDGTTSVPNVVASGFILSDKEIGSAHFHRTGDENGRSCTENRLLDSSTKRKRGPCTNIDVSKNDDDDDVDDDMTPINKLKTKATQELITDGGDGSDSADSSSDIESTIKKLRSRNDDNKTWLFEIDMISAFQNDPKLCMNAVCALYRQQLRKGQSVNGSSLTKNQGFTAFDLMRGTAFGEYLTAGDPERKLNKSVAELQQYDPQGLDYCRKLAMRYSHQLFEIHQKEEDPFFLPT